MPDYYRLPALFLLTPLLLVFVYLHLRFQEMRTRLWLIGWSAALLRAVLQVYNPQNRFVSGLSEAVMELAAVLFLASLTPECFSWYRYRVAGVLLFGTASCIYAFLVQVFPAPSPFVVGIYYLLWAIAAVGTFRWNSLLAREIPGWLGLGISGLYSCAAVWFLAKHGWIWPVLLILSGTNLMTGLLILFRQRRITPGTLFASIGFFFWTLPPLFLIHGLRINDDLDIALNRIVSLTRVVAAIGMILLVLEDELRKNRKLQLHELQVRRELEAYSQFNLASRMLSGLSAAWGDFCQLIASHSRFERIAILLPDKEGQLEMAGFAGMDPDLARDFELLGLRLALASPTQTALATSQESALLSELTFVASQHPEERHRVALENYLRPGDLLARLAPSPLYALPLVETVSLSNGLLLLHGLRKSLPMTADDLLPIQLFLSRMYAALGYLRMTEKLVQNERLAGIGQLASGIAHQLNNPLSVVMGYADLLAEETPGAPAQAIRSEARRMKSILESLSRFSRPSAEEHTRIYLPELLRDLEQLSRQQFVLNSIDFDLEIQENLPSVQGNAHQIRQALLHAIQYGTDALARLSPHEERKLRLEATSEGDHVQILITDSGPGFADPDRIFDPFYSSRDPHQGGNLSMSLCYIILRENQGKVTALNLQPKGSAIVIELPALAPA